TLLSCAAVFVMVALNFGCADPNKKPVDSTPTVVPAPSEGTTQDKVPETPADVKKTVETEEDFKKAMEEIYQEIMAFFPSDPSVPSEEPEPSQYRSMRTAAPSEAELFEGDKAIEPLSEFIATFFKAVLDAVPDSWPAAPLSSFQLKDSINVKNLSFDQIIKAIDKFLTKEENKNMVEEIFSPYNSVDELLVDLADSLEVEDVEALKAKLNECITLTKLKYSGTLSIDQIEFREVKVNETPEHVECELISETKGIFNISDMNEEFGLKVEKLDSLLQFLTGNTAAFPIKNVTVEEALKILDALFMTPLGVGHGTIGSNDINDIENEINEWMAGYTSPEQYPDTNEFRINGTASSKIAFDFETASYTGTIEVSLNLEATTELFQNIMNAFENDSEAEAVELLNKIGGITISVKDSTFSSSSKLGDLIVSINESISKK
ncbi:MAG: hypothetical protein KIG91_02360, partial [Treponema sp.]|nr:hypothetical protein [Treponema sp.]